MNSIIIRITKFLLYMNSFFILNIASSEEYILESSSKTISKKLLIDNNFKYESIEIDGRWKDSNGEYGISKCYGSIKSKNNLINLEAYCETTDSVGDKAWFTITRNTEMKAGVGSSKYIAATGKYKRLIGLKCPYAVKYFDKEFNFYMHKCIIN